MHGYAEWQGAKEHTDPRFAGAVDAFARSLAMAKDRLYADVVHCHTHPFLLKFYADGGYKGPQFQAAYSGHADHVPARGVGRLERERA